VRPTLVLGVALAALFSAACGGGGNASPVPAAGALAPTEPEIVSAAPQVDQAKAAGEYWTTERMKSATPVDLIDKAGKPKSSAGTPPPEGRGRLVPASAPQGPARRVPLAQQRFKLGQARGYPYPYSRYRWSGPTTSLPARTWGKVFFSTPNGDYVCSGTAVSSQNESVVWTAGHCTANPGAKRFYNHRWVFVPGYDNGTAPFGRFVGKRFFTTRAWYRLGDSAFDLAAVVVAPLKGRTLVETVGGQGIAFNQPRVQEYVSGGYPADYPFDGDSLYICDAPLGSSDRATAPPTIAIGCDMTGGSSGGGWLVGVKDGLGTLVSVNSYGYFSQPDAMYGPYQGNAAQRLYDQASRWR
jgi:V8-like Glu-specific endopeptidase